MRLILSSKLYILVGCPFQMRQLPWKYGFHFDGDGARTGYPGSWYTKLKYQAAKLWEVAEPEELRRKLKPKNPKPHGKAGERIQIAPKAERRYR